MRDSEMSEQDKSFWDEGTGPWPEVKVVFELFRNRDTFVKESAILLKINAQGRELKHSVVVQNMGLAPRELDHPDILAMLRQTITYLLKQLEIVENKTPTFEPQEDEMIERAIKDRFCKPE